MPTSTSKSDADRLIAAAPDMLEALIMLLKNEGLEGFSLPYDKARDAVEKATGKPFDV